MKMKMNRKEELMEYVRLLNKLAEDGFRCQKELNQALAELHELMLEDKPSKLIYVFEETFEGVVRSVELFQTILSQPRLIRSQVGDDHRITSGNTYIEVLKVGNMNMLRQKVRGQRPDYIINNTENANLLEDLQIKVNPS